jgi:hypothetical protein
MTAPVEEARDFLPAARSGPAGPMPGPGVEDACHVQAADQVRCGGPNARKREITGSFTGAQLFDAGRRCVATFGESTTSVASRFRQS